MDHEHPMAGRCRQGIEVRDTYRYTGGRGGFALHYNWKQCSRGPETGFTLTNGYCWQHVKPSPQAR